MKRFNIILIMMLVLIFNVQSANAFWGNNKGDKGDKGDRGEQGIQGERGYKGSKGDKGDKGEQGIQGEKGNKGDKGSDANVTHRYTKGSENKVPYYGYNDYYSENAFKNSLIKDGYSEVFDSNITGLDLVEVGYFGKKGNPNIWDSDYVLREEWEKYSAQYQDIRIDNNKSHIKTNKTNINKNKKSIKKETQQRKQADKKLNKKITKVDNKHTTWNKSQDKNIKQNKKDIHKETKQRKKADKILDRKIKQEEKERKIADRIEKRERIKEDKRLGRKITKVDNKHTDWNNKQDAQINNNANAISDLDNRMGALEETQQIVGVQLRVHDSQKWQVNLFADYSMNRNKVDRTGIRFQYKFGKSYEEKLIEELKNELQN